MIGAVSIPPDATDSFLANLHVYRLWVEDRGDPPSLGYYPTTGPEIVDEPNQRVTRTDSWQEMTTQEYADHLQAAKAAKLLELKAEANLRFATINEWVDSIDAYLVLEAVVQMIKPAARDPAPQLLLDIKAVADAGRDARDVIVGYTTLEQVAAYDVATDPAWPA
jgi:hypothetical protein